MTIELTATEIKECSEFLNEAEEFFWGLSPNSDELDIELDNDSDLDTFDYMNA